MAAVWRNQDFMTEPAKRPADMLTMLVMLAQLQPHEAYCLTWQRPGESFVTRQHIVGACGSRDVASKVAGLVYTPGVRFYDLRKVTYESTLLSSHICACGRPHGINDHSRYLLRSTAVALRKA